MVRICFAPGLIAAAILTVSFSWFAAAGELATTHRAGDFVLYQHGCHDAESMIKVAKKGGAADVTAAMFVEGKCYSLPKLKPALLLEWLAGTFYPIDSDEPGSVWAVRDQHGKFVFAFPGLLGR